LRKPAHGLHECGPENILAICNDWERAFFTLALSTGLRRGELQTLHWGGVEANAFGAALLMPARLVREEIKKHDLDLDDEDDLSALAKNLTSAQLRCLIAWSI